jgi:hypothetical protein
MKSPPEVSDLSQGGKGVIYLQEKSRMIKRELSGGRDDGSLGTLEKGLGNKLVAVKIGPFEGNKKFSLLQGSGIGGEGSDSLFCYPL